MMEKRYLCFTCYHYHPEMRGVSQAEFNAAASAGPTAGKNVCDQPKCPFKGSPLEPAEYCEKCEKMFKAGEHRGH